MVGLTSSGPAAADSGPGGAPGALPWAIAVEVPIPIANVVEIYSDASSGAEQDEAAAPPIGAP
jgi:hypothetical protein